MRVPLRNLSVWALVVLPTAGAWASEAAAATGGTTHHGLPLVAPRLTEICGIPITNSMIECMIVAVLIIVVVQLATRKMEFIPGPLQNFVEWLIESLYEFIESVIGPHLTRRTFWFLASVFVFILTANWLGLLPGVGSIGWGVRTAQGFKVTEPLLRGANADINMTLGLALFFTVMWFVWSWQEQGPVGMIKHLFAPKGGMQGFMLYLMGLIFLLVGLIELLQILVIRPLALTLRLFGNIYAGENLIETLLSFRYGGWLSGVFGYFIELLVGLIQATVFMLLSAVFTFLMCQHEEEGESTGEAPH